MDASKPTVISVGKAIRSALLEDTTLRNITGGAVFPLATRAEHDGPYILYRRKSGHHTPVTSGVGPFEAVMEVWCVAPGYEVSVVMAEAVLRKLNGYRGESAGIRIRRCLLEDASEDVVADVEKYVQILTFKLATT